VSGRVVALIDLSSLWKTAHPRSLALVTTAARTIEQRLLEVRRDQDARLRRRYGDLMTRSTDVLVGRDGYVLAGDEREHSKTLDIPEGGGEVVLGDGSVAEAASIGQGEAYLLRRVTTRRAKSARAEVLERSEKHVRELVTEQAALRQVATLVARESSPDQLFAAVTEQVARVFDVPHVRLVRYELDGSVVVGGSSEEGALDKPFPIGSRWPRDSPGVIATVRQTGRPARVEDYAGMSGEIAAVVRGAGMRSAVASPIVVERRLWGAMVLLSPRPEPLPENTEGRLTDFTELVATAIANAESRAAVTRRRRAVRPAARRDTGCTRGIPSESLRGRRRGGRPLITRRKRLDGPLRTGRQRYLDGLVELLRACLYSRRALADQGHERRVDGAPDGQAGSHRRLLSCHRPDRHRRAGGRLQIGDWKPDRRRRSPLGRHLGCLDRRADAAGQRGAPHFVHGARRDGDRKCRIAERSRAAGRRAGSAAARGNARRT